MAEFAYTEKPLLLTQERGNPGWNEVGRAIAEVVDRSDRLDGLATFLDRVERDEEPTADARRNAVRRLFPRPRGGTATAIARHIRESDP